ncbi:hypothetical protein Hanom_Chr17g01524621 [Helianthus anomalus]
MRGREGAFYNGFLKGWVFHTTGRKCLMSCSLMMFFSWVNGLWLTFWASNGF